ncbi:MAG: heat-inducible transcription repressor HrcA [Firmicutes bacterium]|nr:heat-inducible transcription repressor HrcA [Bacillota bacterium]
MDKRQEELLKAIVESYVKTVKPVGSKSLCQKFHCSSATIRNEMAVLESLGYIEKNHISSGRVPSELGYKYYVDYLMEPEKLTGSDMLKLQTIVKNQDLVLSDAINKCMEIISDLTNYASVVLGNNSSGNLLKQVSIIPIENNKIVALVCTNKGVVENKQFVLPESTDVSELIKTSEIINKMLIGTPINEVASRLEFEIKPVIAKQIHDYEAIYNIFYNAFNDFASDHHQDVRVVGKAKILEQPEYNDAPTIKKLAYKLEDKEFIKHVVENKDNEEIKIYIGEDSEVDKNTTVIKRKYDINGESGTIAIIGPKRMEYARVMGLLDYVLDEIKKKDDK